MRAPLLALFLCGCLPTTYVCYDDAECVSDGKPGVCTPAHACAFSVTDDVCPSQLRYAHAVPASVADQCYLPDVCATTPPTGQTFCDGLSVFECEDFEDDTAFAAWQPKNTDGSSTMLDTTRSCRGKSSVKMTLITSDMPSHAALELDEPAPLPDPIYGRAFYYFASPLPVAFSNASIFTLQQQSSLDGTQLLLENDKLALNNYKGETLGNIEGSDLTVPADKWICLEWKISLGDGTIDVWFDGKAVASLALDSMTNGLTFPPTLDSAVLMYGVSTSTSTSQTLTSWVDEVILDRAPIGCTR